MDDVDDFLATVAPRMAEEVRALQRGDGGPRMALWSHEDPVTLFGAELTRRGWSELRPAFEWLADSFSGGTSVDYDVLAAGVSGDLGYVVAIERSVAASGDAAPRTYALRVTTVFRRETDGWKIVHRHGDPYDREARDALADRIGEVGAPERAQALTRGTPTGPPPSR